MADGFVESNLKYLGGLVAMVALVLGGTRCSADGGTATPAATTQSATTPTVATTAGLPAAPTPPAMPTSGAASTPLASPHARILAAKGNHVMVRLEVADTDQSRATGLSKRASLPEDSGMVFIFPTDQQAAFWMKDTLIPLSIAFISTDGQILEIQDMQAMSEELHRPARPYRYALEVNQGFFRKNSIVAGDRVDLQLGGAR